MFFGILVTIWAVLSAVLAFKGTSPLEPKPDKYKDVPGCYITEFNKVVPFGKEETAPSCILYKCEAEYLEYYTCDIKMTSPDCKLFANVDISKPYPECCPVFECYHVKLVK